MTFKLICFDMDGVIFEFTNFWMELHKVFDTYEEGKKLSDLYLDSDYEKLVSEVVGELWKGKDAKSYFYFINSIKYLSGVEETFDFVKNKYLLSAIVSGSSLDLAKKVQRDFNVNYVFANNLVIKNGLVSGEFHDIIKQGYEFKVKVISDLCLKLGLEMSEVVYVGDSKFDVDAFKEVGFSIAFNSDCD